MTTARGFVKLPMLFDGFFHRYHDCRILVIVTNFRMTPKNQYTVRYDYMYLYVKTYLLGKSQLECFGSFCYLLPDNMCDRFDGEEAENTNLSNVER